MARWSEGKAATVLLVLLALAGITSPVWVGSVRAQSAQLASFVREVNSNGIYTLLETISNTVGGTLDVDLVKVNGQTPLDAANDAQLQGAATANGNGSTVSTDGYTSARLTVAITNTATTHFECTEDGTVYVALFAQREGSTPTIASSATASSVWRVNVAGCQAIRARIADCSSCTVTVTARAVLGNVALVPELLDPCAYKKKSKYVVNMSTATTNEIANAVTGENFYICEVNLNAHDAQTVALGEDDTDGCGSITAGLHGGATAATGWSFAAEGGIVLGNGSATVLETTTAGRYLCIITGQAAQLSGAIFYVSAP